jgi:hypothetical protein
MFARPNSCPHRPALCPDPFGLSSPARDALQATPPPPRRRLAAPAAQLPHPSPTRCLGPACPLPASASPMAQPKLSSPAGPATHTAHSPPHTHTHPHPSPRRKRSPIRALGRCNPRPMCQGIAFLLLFAFTNGFRAVHVHPVPGAATTWGPYVRVSSPTTQCIPSQLDPKHIVGAPEAVTDSTISCVAYRKPSATCAVSRSPPLPRLISSPMHSIAARA